MLDLMGGTGTTTLAALAEQRHSIYVENDLPRVATAKARVETFFRNEKAKHAYLKVQLGEVLDEEMNAIAKEYSRGAVVDAMKPSLAEVESFVKQHIDEGLPRMARLTWRMEGKAARDMVVTWLLCKDKAGFNGFVTQSTENHPYDAVAYLARYEASKMMEEIERVKAMETEVEAPGPSIPAVRI